MSSPSVFLQYLSLRLQSYSASPGAVKSLYLSKNHQLLSGHEGGEVVLWSFTQTEAVNVRDSKTMKAAGCAVHALTLAANSPTLYTGDHAGVLRLHDLSTNQPISEFPGGAGKCRAIRLYKTDCIATGGQDGVIRLWDCRKKRCLSALKNHSGGIVDLQFTADKKHLLVGAKDGSLKQWDLSVLRNPETVSSSEPIAQLAVNGNQAVTLHTSGMMKIWDLRTFEMSASEQTIEGRCFGLEAGSSRVSYICGRKSLQVYRLDTGEQTCSHKAKWKSPQLCRELSQIYCVCTEQSALTLWGVQKTMLTLEKPQGFAWEQIVP